MNEYRINLFKLNKAEPILLQIYNVQVSPRPEKRPLYYEILGIVAKKLTNILKTPIISDEGLIKVAGDILPDELLHHKISIPNIDEYKVKLIFTEKRESSISNFNEYKRLVNRIIDISLVYFSEDFYKYHPHAPYIIKYEHVFDKNLIENTGIIDYKEYYRSLRLYHNEPYVILNRGTQIRSHKNVLNEIKCLLVRFAKIRQKPDDFYDFYYPPKDFISYINSIFRGKSANVLGYPGPSLKNIQGVTWEYRGGDVAPGQSLSCCDYLAKYYGIRGLDRNQPLFEYLLEKEERTSTQYHLPEVLSIGHNFKDLEKIIPPWQRKQVWDYINPNCKNQMREIFRIIRQIDSSLRSNMPEIYPSKLEISTMPVDATPNIVGPEKIDISFSNKDLSLEPPYNENFYRLYGKSICFVDAISKDIRTLVFFENKTSKINEFIVELQKEFKRRNAKELIIEYGDINFKKKNYKNYDLIFTISDSDKLYNLCKTVIQNKGGIIHQNVLPNNATLNSIVPITMQLSLMFGGNPWLLKNFNDAITLIGIYFYRSSFFGGERCYYNILNGKGKFLYQSPPFSSDDVDSLLESLYNKVNEKKRVLFLLSFSKTDFQDKLVDLLDTIKDLDYIITSVIKRDNLRIFNTWEPSFIEDPRRKRRLPTIRYPFESFENAPQGVILDAGNNVYYIVTSRSLRHQTGFRGCPYPIRVEMFSQRGDFKESEVLTHILSLVMMGRLSGHATRLPSPLNYLQKLAYYIEKFGEPINEDIKQSLFYI